jgi:hypothetical protein
MALVTTGLVVALALLARGAGVDGELQFTAKPSESPDRAAAIELPSQPVSVSAGELEDATSSAIMVPRSPEPELETSETAVDAVLVGAARQPASESYGTAVHFLSRPSEAARQALREDKLLLVLHVSGNFEDARFT